MKSKLKLSSIVLHFGIAYLNFNLSFVYSKLIYRYNGDQAQIVEVTANMKGGATVRATVDNDNDMYAAIDKVSHILSNNLKKHSETHNSLNAKRKHQKVLLSTSMQMCMKCTHDYTLIHTCSCGQ